MQSRAFEKAGWKREGVLRKRFFSKGKLTDYIILGIQAKEYWEGREQ
jgi:RimJ/RimL family protein N-acetyltransferase